MSEKCYIDKLDEIVDKYSNKYHRAIQTKPIDIKSGEQIEYSADQNDKYKVGDHIIISQYKNSFAKGYISNCSEKVFIIKEVTTLHRDYILLVIIIVKKLLKHSMTKKCRKQIKQSLG